MRKIRFYFLIMAALALSFVLVLAGCGADADPKDLAKQTYDLNQQALGALFNSKETTELQKKLANIQKKVQKLSNSDKVIYTQELAQLTGQGLGGLLNAASDFLNTASDSFNATSNLLNDNSVQGTQVDTQDALNTAGQALDVAQRALDLLNALGD